MAASKAIEALKEVFPADQLAVGGTEEFDKLNNSYLSLLQSELVPAAIFLPKSKDEVVKFVQTIKPFALTGDVSFAIRGAGQQPVPGCSNIAGNGITLDLRFLTGIELKDGVVSLGAGERWGPIYEKLHEQGLGVSGSRSALGGIGGLALAGGLSFFSSREGFICDTVVNYEIVLSSGETVNANSNENPDLFRALRGGGNNFGIVTRFDLRTFKQGPFWGGAVFYFPSAFSAQVQAYCDELNKPDASEETHIMVSQGYSGLFKALGGHFCMNQLYYTREVEKPAVLEPFVSVQPQIDAMNSMRMLTLKDAANEQAKQSSDCVRCAYMNTTVKADAATLIAASNIFTAAFQPLVDLDGFTCAFTLQAYPVSLLKKCDNSLGLDAANGPLMSILLLNWWKNKTDDDLVIQTFKGVLQKIDEDAAARGTAVPYKYMNYAYRFQDPITSYGDELHGKLRDVSNKYDAEGLFQKGVPGGFKLG
ncbi:hypothetical protein BDV95DRAFT_260051 [Massariosphaeria phaeospora]|uniref:FAD-binding PCMH-type domain-containing protein n=1 Tax=Massariosphaeria phaeospora TaxID=100035 RepID=A0A7C8M222_9PLEO|nr:hypothetical protein BDV95DRAFT_260051 [Massariosphaeria phaeospora]